MAWYDGIGIIEKTLDLFILIFNKTKRKPSNVFNDSNTVESIADAIVNNSGLSVDCFFLVLAHNGGKKLNPLNLKYRTIMGGRHREWLMRNFDIRNYKNLLLDYDYNELLSNIYEDRRKNNGVDVSIEDTKDSMKQNLSFENIKFAKFFFLNYSNDGMWYLMVGTTQAKERLDDIQHKQKLLFAVNKIKNIIKRY